MAKTTYSLAKSKNNLGEAQIIIRMYVRMGYFVRIKSNIWVDEKRWGKKIILRFRLFRVKNKLRY